MAYLTNTEVGNYLNKTLTAKGQTLVDSLIEAVSAFVDRECNRSWTNGAGDDITETFDGGQYIYFPRIVPIASITSVTVNGTVLESDSYYNYGSYVRLATTAVALPRTVVIVYRTSATEIPSDMKEALKQWVGQLFLSATDGGKKTSRVQMGAVSIDYVTKDGVPKFVQDVIDGYRLHPVV